MNTKLLSALADVIVYVNGEVDWDSTFGGIKSAISKEIADNRAHDTAISAALNRLYDNAPAGSSFPTPMVVQSVAGEIANGNFALAMTLAPMVENFIRRSPSFEAKRGRAGGLRRIG